MKMKSFVPVLLALLLLLALPLFAAAEEEGLGSAESDWLVATPTDLAECPHEHTETTIYFYDSPSYFAVDENVHRVAGTAVIETDCADCGEVLDIQDDTYAEETRPHTFKNNVCALCGFRRRAKETEAPKVIPQADAESTVYAARGDSGLYSLVLTSADLQEMEGSGVAVLLVRDKQNSDAAVALNVQRMHAQTRMAGMDLHLDLVEREDGSFFTDLCLEHDGKEQVIPDKAAVTLRFYRAKTPALKVSLSPAETDSLTETETAWNESGYWTVPYQDDGTYFPKQ